MQPALESLLNIFNNIWIAGEFPPSWSEATIVPIPKPGKDPTNPGNYRPIALTSCVCKTLCTDLKPGVLEYARPLSTSPAKLDPIHHPRWVTG